MTIVNEFMCDKHYLTQQTKAWFNRNLCPWPVKGLLIISALCSIVLIVQLQRTRLVAVPAMLLFGVAILVMLLIFRFRQSVRITHERIQVLNMPFPSMQRTRINLAAETVTVEYEGSHGTPNSLHLYDAVDHYQDDEYYYLQFRGNILVALRKGAFVEGSDDNAHLIFDRLEHKPRFIALLISIILAMMLTSVLYVCMSLL